MRGKLLPFYRQNSHDAMYRGISTYVYHFVRPNCVGRLVFQPKLLVDMYEAHNTQDLIHIVPSSHRKKSLLHLAPIMSLFRRIISSPAARTLSKRGLSAFSVPVASTSTRSFSTMDTMESGTKTYMSLYPEGSTDGSIRLGNIVPDFSCETTQGNWDS